MINEPVGHQDMDPHVGVGSLECPHQGRKQCPGHAWRRRDPQHAGDPGQPVRDDVGDGLAKFGATQGMLENFCPDIGEPQSVRRTFEQTDAKLAFEVGNAAAGPIPAAEFVLRRSDTG